MRPSRDITRLLEIMAALRSPKTGCNWDLAQTFESLLPYAIEEAYEVVDAVERGDREDLREELGDLLLQVVFHARLAEEEGAFDFGGVVEAITTKLVRRHPHVFGDLRDLNPGEVRALWDTIKREEKAEWTRRRGGDGETPEHWLDSVAVGLPSLLRAEKLQSKAAKVGFDWNDAQAVLAKIREETDEVAAALDDPAALAGEIGDLLFAVVNLARHARIDSETALRATNAKFVRRFGFVEDRLAAAGRSLQAASLDEMEALWNAAKADERH